MSNSEPRIFYRPWWLWLSRYRHTRGFGVHSPLAYRIITEVIPRNSSSYYPALPAGTISYSDYTLMAALISFLKPQSIWIENDINLMRQLRDLVDSTLKLTREHPDMVIVTPGNTPGHALLADCLKHGGSVLVTDNRDDDLNDTLPAITTMTAGMTFSNGRTLIAIGRRDLPRQHFELNFK